MSNKDWAAEFTIGRFTWKTTIYELLPEVYLMAPTEAKPEYRTTKRKMELEDLDIPKRWSFRLKEHNDKNRTAWYDFYEQQ